MDPGARINRLRWLARRGMKELDILLQGFLARETPALQRGEWRALEKLLACEDDQLWDWLQGRAVPTDPELKTLVDAIRG